MDPCVDSSLGIGPIMPMKKMNSYSGDVPAPEFRLRYQPGLLAEPVSSFSFQPKDSFLSSNIQDDITVLSQRLEDLSAGSEVIKKGIESIDSLFGAMKMSRFKYTRDYYDMRTLDMTMGLIPNGSRALLFTPKAREYFAEKKCEIVINIFRSNIETSGGRLRLPSKMKADQVPDDEFYVSAVDYILRDELMLLAFDDISLEGRWRKFDDLVDNKVDTIVLEEDPFGRTGEHLVKDLFYDIQFFEPCLRSMRVLNDGGSVIIKFSSLGARFVSDLIYIYKYLFREVTLVKPASSNPVGFEHYMTAKEFRPDRYLSIRDTLDKLMNRLSADMSKADIEIHSLVRNLDDSASFVNWITNMNDRIGFWTYSNILSLYAFLEDRALGFGEGHPTLILDQSQYRESIGLIGRTTLQSVPEFETFDTLAEEGMEDLTETGQVKSVMTVGTDSILGLGFLIYISLNLVVVEEILKLPIFQRLMPILGTMIGQQKISSTILHERKQFLIFNIREWLGLLYGLGDIEYFLNGENITEAQIRDRLGERQWTPVDIIGSPIADANLNLVELYSLLASIFIKFSKTIMFFRDLPSDSPQNILNRIILSITSLDNLRYRLAYSLDGVKYGLMEQSHSSVLGEYELINLLIPRELAQLEDYHGVSSLLPQKAFKNRVFNHSCLPVFFSGPKNEYSIPELYFNYKPDLEYFASAVNRHAPYWCSANPEDKSMGSMGNFFGHISDSSHDLYSNGSVKLAMAFPPNHYQVLRMVFPKLISLFKNLLEDHKTGKRDHFAMIIVYENNIKNNELFEDVVMDSELNGAIMTTKPVKKVYDPFTGKFHLEQKLKAVCYKTPGNPFML